MPPIRAHSDPWTPLDLPSRFERLFCSSGRCVHISLSGSTCVACAQGASFDQALRPHVAGQETILLFVFRFGEKCTRYILHFWYVYSVWVGINRRSVDANPD